MAEEKSAGQPEDSSDAREAPEERSAEVELEGALGRYRVTARTLHLHDAKGKEKASIFSTTYLLQGVEDVQSRPVTFCFNGGPGSSSVWLQFGALGPKRVDIPDTVTAPPPPHQLADNPLSLLEHSDLVFIDPVGTGFSRPAGEVEAKAFHSVKEDIASVGEFIARWLTEEQRWQSPKFLAGESYGTTRASGLARYLQGKGIALNGLVLISVATDFTTLVAEPGNDLPYVLYLPSMTAVSVYHGVVPEPEDMSALLREVETFALEEYAPALLLGDRLAPERAASLAKRMADYTGLDADWILRRKLRIPYLVYVRQVLGDGPETVGRLDGRYRGPDLDPYGQSMQRDPSYDAALPAYTVAVNDFLRRIVGWESEEAYAVLSIEVNQGWKWDQDRMGYPNTTDALRQAMIANPHMKVLMASGYHDLATPYFACQYTADHLGVDASLKENLRMTWYEAGHMMYFHPPSLIQLSEDLGSFYRWSVGG